MAFPRSIRKHGTRDGRARRSGAIRTPLPRRISVRLLALLTAAASTWVMSPAPAPSLAALPEAGLPGVGDSYFPGLGNGGFDVRHYDLDVRYAPDSGRLDGRTTITARATRPLSSFDLDLQRLDVASVEVNGIPAGFRRDGDELRVHPVIPLPKGRTFTTTVTYGGVPEPLGGPVVFGSRYGWMKTKDGAFVACEPNAASTWFPSSDHPSDKATFDIRIRAPKGLTAISNGRLLATSAHGATTVTHWRENKPMAPYLATATIGKFDVKRGTTPGGTPLYVATDPTLAAGKLDMYALTAEATDHWSRVFGPYPFEETGAIIDDVPQADFSLEAQTKPLFSAVRDESTVVHELAHQWFGDSVSVERWKDIWLNEGFATYAEWLWDEHKGRKSAHQSFLEAYDLHHADDPFWKVVVADPQRETMLSRAVYYRGAMTLQMLRERIGDRAFFRLLPRWTKLHRHGNARTAQFTALAEAVSHKDLGDLFTTWLHTPGKPALPGR
ncbi:metallopeptidase [Streptomyces cinnamoneus]|uniref:Aminopeptidase N n=1 Tax=Streptomyces cinnamoneus TaxID=53446 RepID=A0A2G1XEQ2_STRCJ|nr:M1 family metallopeptidase [Streptomyces cinnamoneus]PHQ49703.1 metallopeptidase [Streptomyces cinnamoneus]PPT16722.1 M1 family peptidase [Streptomyces cinnamoneus]